MFNWFRSWQARRAVRRSMAGTTGGIFIYDLQPDGTDSDEAVVPINKKLVMVSVVDNTGHHNQLSSTQR